MLRQRPPRVAFVLSTLGIGMGRTAVFIDGGYIAALARDNLGGVRLDFEKLVDHVIGHSELLRAYYYDCAPYQSNPPTDEEKARVRAKQSFFSALSRLPRFQLRQGKLEHRGTRDDGRPLFVQKRVDLMLGVDMVQLAATRQIDKACLIAGDSDFVPAIEMVKQHGVLVSLWHGPRGGVANTVHRELWDICDDRDELTPELAATLTHPVQS